MADSTAATGSWWKALTSSRKKAKEGPVAGAPPPPAEPALPPAPPGPDSRENQQPNFSSSEPKFGEKPGGGGGSSRRNLKISRSGRFKEKRKVRAPLLAESPKLFEGSAPSHASEERQ
ncbi:Proline-rich protein 15 [Platysternon megacephalum]|uniref:Proline-rich protein 15 n=1 Tax=Platysternon megacephalum TaxID=55544 RepID=A0A4D9EA48_9SAUR|nr:Proline-rich protein 15 [Platysternon megacephalum]